MTKQKVSRNSIKAMAIAASITFVSACQPSPQENKIETAKPEATVKVTYPETRKGEVVDTYFGQQVPDPYRWLEDDRSPETEQWVKTQNITTQNFLSNISYRSDIADKLRNLINYERVSAPFRGSRDFPL